MADYRNKYVITIGVECGTNKKVTPEDMAKAIKDNWNFTPGVDSLSNWADPDKDFAIKYTHFDVKVFPKFDMEKAVKTAFPEKTKKKRG